MSRTQVSTTSSDLKQLPKVGPFILSDYFKELTVSLSISDRMSCTISSKVSLAIRLSQ
jgi:hypothetical protein